MATVQLADEEPPRATINDNASSRGCTFAELVPVFAELFEPNPARVTALIAQIKHLIKLGIGSSRPGRGRTGHFGCEEVRRMLIAMEFCHLGVTPAKAIKLVHNHAGDFFGATEPVTVVIGPRDSAIRIDVPALREACRERLPILFTGRR